jgi:CheY-like chemotaxis protein
MALPLTPAIAATEIGGTDSEYKRAAAALRPHILIVSNKPEVTEWLRGLLRPFKFTVEVCPQTKAVAEVISRKKINGVLLAWSQDAPRVIAKLRSSASNRTTVICAVVENATQRAAAFTGGCNFAIDQPSSTSNVHGLMRVLNGLVIREHRRYYRCARRIPVTVVSPAGSSSALESLNLSESGISLQLPYPTQLNDKVRMSIDVSDGKAPIQLDAQVRWVGVENRAGLSFTAVPVAALIRLQKWIDAHITMAEKAQLTRTPLFAM